MKITLFRNFYIFAIALKLVSAMFAFCFCFLSAQKVSVEESSFYLMKKRDEQTCPFSNRLCKIYQMIIFQGNILLNVLCFALAKLHFID